MRRILIACLLILPLSACVTDEQMTTFEGKPRSLRVEQQSEFYNVKFDKDSAKLNAEQTELLNAFLRDFSKSSGDRIAVATELDGLDGEEAALSLSRSRTVIEYLKQRGLNPGVTGMMPNGDADSVTVVRLHPHVVLPEECPDWSKSPGYDFSNTGYSNIRCADAVNLGLMIANPMDLVDPAATSPADGAGSVLSVQRYRADKVKELLKETPTKTDK